MTGGARLDERATVWRDRTARLAESRARFEAGEALALGEAIEALPPDDWSPLPAARLDLLAANGAAGAIVGTALGVDPADPLARLPIPAGAWPSAKLVAGDFEWTTIDVVDGRVRLHAVEIRIASAVCGGPVPAVIPFPSGTADAEPPPCMPEAAAPLDQGDAAGAEPEALPGAMMAAAAFIASQDRLFRTDGHSAALAAFGLVLSADGQSIANAAETIGGTAKDVRSGRKPTLGRVLLEAKARQIVEGDPRARHLPATELARIALAWLAERHPDLQFPAAKVAALHCAPILARKNP